MVPRLELFAFSIVLLLLLSQPVVAYADWQYTTWGMTPDEVVAASKGLASRTEDAEKGIKLAVGSHTANGIDYSVSFIFSKGDPRLSSVYLISKDPGVCPTISNQLTDVYGKPESKSASGLATITKWRSGQANALIQLVQIGSSSHCEISYRPIPKPGSGL